jgi:putative FmdB family regulatory protein
LAAPPKKTNAAKRLTMPFYEYECQKCGHHLEAMQKITDAPLRKCPDCGRPALRKLISPPVFRLKGSGWYETDFKSDREAKRNLADRPEKEDKPEKKKEEPAAGAKAGAKDESAPAAKPESAAKSAESAATVKPPSESATRVRKRTARRPK